MEFVSNLTEYKQEDASRVSVNPLVRWAKFILTDDKPNRNGKVVSQSEFKNLISTGIFQPIKMATGKINAGHEDSIPIGVITHLEQEDDKILGLAALWSDERPEDVEFIKESFDNGIPLNLSWEIKYTDSELKDGVEYLKNVALRAATLVGRPAYQGRTPILAVASEQEDNKLEAQNSELETKKKELEDLLTAKASELEALTKELTELRAFKAGIEKERKDAEVLASIKEKFASSGITKEDQYFADNKDRLLSLSEDALAFLLQEFVAFSSIPQVKSEVASQKQPSAPQLNAPAREEKLTPSDLGKKLREMQNKKN